MIRSPIGQMVNGGLYPSPRLGLNGGHEVPSRDGHFQTVVVSDIVRRFFRHRPSAGGWIV